MGAKVSVVLPRRGGGMRPPRGQRRKERVRGQLRNAEERRVAAAAQCRKEARRGSRTATLKNRVPSGSEASQNGGSHESRLDVVVPSLDTPLDGFVASLVGLGEQAAVGRLCRPGDATRRRDSGCHMPPARRTCRVSCAHHPSSPSTRPSRSRGQARAPPPSCLRAGYQRWCRRALWSLSAGSPRGL